MTDHYSSITFNARTKYSIANRNRDWDRDRDGGRYRNRDRNGVIDRVRETNIERD